MPVWGDSILICVFTRGVRGVLPDAASLDAWLRRHRRRCLLYENQSGSQSAYCFSCRMEAASTLHGLFSLLQGAWEGPMCRVEGGSLQGWSLQRRPPPVRMRRSRMRPAGPAFILSPGLPEQTPGPRRRRSVRGPPLAEIRESSCRRRRRDLVFDDHCGAARLHLPFSHPASDRMGLFTNSCCGKKKKKEA